MNCCRHRGDVAYEPGERVKVDFKEMRGEIAATFYLEPTLIEDQGDFTVFAKNPAGEATENFKLTVIGRKSTLRFTAVYPLKVKETISNFPQGKWSWIFEEWQT